MRRASSEELTVYFWKIDGQSSGCGRIKPRHTHRRKHAKKAVDPNYTQRTPQRDCRSANALRDAAGFVAQHSPYCQQRRSSLRSAPLRSTHVRFLRTQVSA